MIVNEREDIIFERQYYLEYDPITIPGVLISNSQGRLVLEAMASGSGEYFELQSLIPNLDRSSC